MAFIILAPLSEVTDTIWLRLTSYLVKVFNISLAKFVEQLAPAPFNSIFESFINCALIPNIFRDNRLALPILMILAADGIHFLFLF